MNITFKNPKTGEFKQVKVGWSWTCFLFSGLFGLPLFLRGLNVWGAIMAGVFVINLLFSGYGDVSIVIFLVALGMEIFFGVKANELTAKSYLEKGWQFVEQKSDSLEYAKSKWGISI